MDTKFTLSISPHLRSKQNVDSAMRWVILALLPAWVWGVYLFGMSVVWLTFVCVLGCVAGEMLVQVLRKRSLCVVKDGSAILTGLLLAMVLPPALPLSVAFMGALFAILIGKAVFGGLGFNIFNPALLGRAFLQVTFPILMTTWTAPWLVDAVSSATPLAMGKFDHSFTSVMTLFMGAHGGCVGETSAFLLLLGGLFLIIMRIVDYTVPVSIFGAVAVMAIVLNLFTGGTSGSVLFHLCSGGLMIGAFFMATDWVTSPITKKGSIVFGIGIGVIVMIIRVLGGLPEGVMFSVLLMNACVPLINRHTRSKIFGETTAKQLADAKKQSKENSK